MTEEQVLQNYIMLEALCFMCVGRLGNLSSLTQLPGSHLQK